MDGRTVKSQLNWGLSVRTAEKHVSKVYKKLSVHNRRDAAERYRTREER
jgi:DNA-binding NarL/FixJ family response regulator